MEVGTNEGEECLVC